MAFRFVPRSEWGHPNPSNPGGSYIGQQRLKYLVQHHTPDQDPTTLAQAKAEVLSIYYSHIGPYLGASDIGYTFLIWDQYVFEGRGWGRTGAHAPGANSTSVGVAMLMDGRYRLPTAIEYQTFRELVDVGKQNHYLLDDVTLTGHRDWVATGCPGDLTYSHLADLWASPAPLPGPTPTPDPTPAPTPSKEPDVYEFNQRYGVTAWNHNGVNYTPWGGAVCLDFPDVAVGDRIIVTGTTPDTEVVATILYPGGKQTVPRLVAWGQPMKVDAEQPGFVTVLVNATAAGRVRAIGRSA